MLWEGTLCFFNEDAVLISSIKKTEKWIAGILAHSAFKNTFIEEYISRIHILKWTRLYVNIQNQMMSFQDTVIQRVAQMSGNLWSSFFSNPQFQSKTTASDHFCVVSLFLKIYSSWIWCHLFTESKYRQMHEIIWSYYKANTVFRTQSRYLAVQLKLHSYFKLSSWFCICYSWDPWLLKLFRYRSNRDDRVAASGQTVIRLWSVTAGNVKLLALYKKGITTKIGLHIHSVVVNSLKCGMKQKV